MAVWSTIGAGALAVIALELLHHPGAPAGPQGGARPTMTVTAPAPAPVVVTLPAASSPAAPARGGTATAGPGTGAAPAANATTTGARPTVSSSSTPTGAQPSPTPTPGPARGPVVDVSAAVVVPLRGATPLAARVALVVPGAPPFPQLLDLALLLP